MSSLTRIIRLTALKNTAFNIFRTVSTQQRNSNVSLTNHLINPWIWQKQDSLKLPVDNKGSFNLPSGIIWLPNIEEPSNVANEIIEAPTNVNTDNTIQAARLIVIRQKKMRKHKLRKLRKRMKFEWAKVRQRRELRKEKEFQAVLIQKCKEAEAFSAEKYVDERLEKLREIIVPKYWKGKRLPDFLIREKMGLPPKK